MGSDVVKRRFRLHFFQIAFQFKNKHSVNSAWKSTNFYLRFYRNAKLPEPKTDYSLKNWVNLRTTISFLMFV